MSCISTMETADLGVLEDLLDCFDRAFHGCSQHRDRFGDRLQDRKTIDPGTQASLGGHCDMLQCELGRRIALSIVVGRGQAKIMRQAPMSAEHRFRYLEFLPLVWPLGCCGDGTALKPGPRSGSSIHAVLVRPD
jgi:hypothetical protein